MIQLTPEKQILVDGFLDEATPEDKRITLLMELSSTDEETVIELISKTFQKKPTVSMAISMAALLPKMQSANAYELAKKYVAYLLKWDIEQLPKHDELLASALPVLNEFNRPESAEIIISAYSRFRNERHEQDAVINSGVFQKLLNGPVTEQQKYEILLILGDHEKLTALEKNESYDAACRKIIKMHSHTRRIKKDLEYLKKRGDMELYKEIMEKVRMKLIPDVIVKAGIIGGIVVAVAFIFFFFIFIYGRNLPVNQVINEITGFGIAAFCAFVIVGTIVLFRYKNR